MTIATGPKWADLAGKDEDRRIQIIGETAAAGRIVGVCLEKDQAEKIARYVRKITERYPTVVELSRVDGPVENVITLRFGPRPS
ncbi:MAG TPA: hypothetical protein VFX20_17985 [Steroidobacteraceae bacterium]|nr:hypothetical protein [Steroidobacteraceae bacterium]